MNYVSGDPPVCEAFGYCSRWRYLWKNCRNVANIAKIIWMSNDHYESLHGERASARTRLIELDNERDSEVVQEARELLKEYGLYMYEELGLTAGKESFFKELENFPGLNYLIPSGIFIVARVGDMAAGCVGIKKFDEDSCEMKRMYIRPACRGKGMGHLLCKYVIDWCRNSMYRRILLDTNLEMKEALSLYRKCGFKEIAPYCINGNDHPVFMEYTL